jgi:DNA invertase Pin-like site-specific DNA recombinase
VTENEQTAQQLAAVRAAVQHAGGRSIVAQYAEDDRSGYKADRGPELERAMTHAVELAKDSAAVELWVWASNRLARGSGLKGEARSVLEVFAYLRRRGVTLRSVTDDQFVTSPMLVGFAAEQAEKYSRDLSANVTRGKDAQWRRGDWIGGPIPDGYVTDEAKGLDLDPERAPIIRHVFDLALDGQASAPIARRLNAEGLQTKRGGAWTRRRIQDLLSNAVYAGLLVRWRGTEREQRRPGRHPAIVTAEEFEAVAHLARQRDASAAARAAAGRPSPRFLLATLGRCASCGGSMYSRTSPYKRKDGTHARSYTCAHVVNGTGLCDAPPVEATAVDAQVLEDLPRYLEEAERWLRELGNDRLGARTRVEDALKAAERRTRALRTRVDRTAERYAAEHDPTSDKAEALLDVLVRQRRDLADAEAEVKRAQAELDAVDQAIEGDVMAVALRSLTDAVAGVRTTSVADFNRRLREHFDGFIISCDQRPVPVWKLSLPVAAVAEIPAVTDDALAALIDRRLDELDAGVALLPLAHGDGGSTRRRVVGLPPPTSGAAAS